MDKRRKNIFVELCEVSKDEHKDKSF